MDWIEQNFKDHQVLTSHVLERCKHDIITIAECMIETLTSGGTIYWCGNGGSAADCQHLAAELIGRFKKDRMALRSIALSTDTSVLTSVSNDYSFENIYARQVQGLCRLGDLLVGISTSGNSRNIIKAFEAARSVGVKTVGMFGNSGGEAKTIVDYSLIIPSKSTARIQEKHILVGHCLCDLIEEGLGLN